MNLLNNYYYVIIILLLNKYKLFKNIIICIYKKESPYSSVGRASD